MDENEWEEWAAAIMEHKSGGLSMRAARVLERRAAEHLPYTGDAGFNAEFKKVLRKHGITMEELTAALVAAADMTTD